MKDEAMQLKLGHAKMESRQDFLVSVHVFA
jgi:hypothetical protein